MKDYFTELTKYENNEEKEIDLLSSKCVLMAQPNEDIGMTSMAFDPETAAIMGVVEITKESIRCYTEYLKCKEHEVTERKKINAQLKIMEYQINARKESYLKHLACDHEERMRLFEIAEKAQEVALKVGDLEMLKIACNQLLNVYTASHDYKE